MSKSVGYPAIIDSSEFDGDMLEWAARNAALVQEVLDSVGAILFKGTPVDNPERLEAFAKLTSAEIPNFTEESSPRSPLGGRVLTSTDYPSAYPIQFHNEYSYAARWPMKLHFCCFRPPATGGETPIADTRRVLANLSRSTRDAFERHGVLYIRNYRPNFGVSWQRSFSTEDPTIVEKICNEAQIECEWRGGGVLRTRQHGDAILAHPRTGQSVWFNHAFFFNLRAIEPLALRDVLLSNPPDDPLYTNTLLGDGSQIDSDVIEELRSSYQRASASNRWNRGDLLLIDNMLSAHARAAFTGKREIAVVMTDSCLRRDIVPKQRPGQ
jgi:alpha-ketoglutarate-dependent taurine dioxygenase